MIRLQEICEFLESFAPLSLAETWDNVGLLVGARDQRVSRIMTCLTITPRSAAEAVGAGAGMIVTHHPLPFRPLQRLTSDTTTGRLLLSLIRAEIAVYSPHTAFDSATQGINRRLADALLLEEVAPLVPQVGEDDGTGTGRRGRLAAPESLGSVTERLKAFLGVGHVQRVGRFDQPVRQVAIGCGSAGQFLPAAIEAGCDCLVTGETNFHTALEAEATETALLLVGHFASERFAVEQLADVLGRAFPVLDVWASRHERDPLEWV